MDNKYIKKFYAIGILILLIWVNIGSTFAGDVDIKSVSSVVFDGNTLYVGGSGPNNYTRIQDAIDNATTNNTIYVYPGIYMENILLDKTLTLMGDKKLTTIIDGGGQYDVIHIRPMAHRVTITGFTIQNSGSVVGAGFDVGLEIHSHNNIITNNIFTHHFNMAIELFSSNSNMITYNLFNTINRTGLGIMSSCDNLVSKNTFTNIGEKCILLDLMGNSSSNEISYNMFSGNFKGIITLQSENIIHHNDFINNTNHAQAHYNIIRLKKSRNQWYENYWDDWRGYGPKYIHGFLGLFNLNFDWNPASEPNNQGGVNASIDQSDIQPLGDGTMHRWAVIIGVGINPHQYIYCRRDTRDLYNLLIQNGWADDHIMLLLEEEATREKILNVFQWLNESGIDEDDLLFFYSGTHGYYMDDQPPIDEPDGRDEFIQPFDYDWDTDDFCIRDDELAVEFSRLKTQNMAIFIESCHSGGMLDGTSDLCASGRVVITACDVDESGWPLVTRMHWLFPHYVIKGLRGRSDNNKDHWASIEETYQYIRLPVMIRSALFTIIRPKVSFQIQHPQIFDGWPTIENNEEDLKLISLT